MFLNCVFELSPPVEVMSERVEETLIADKSEEEPLEKQAVYYPNNIGFPSPLEQNDHEFVLIGLQNEKREALSRILKIFEDQKATIVSLSFFNDQSPNQFVANVVADLSEAKSSPDEMMIRLGMFKDFVKTVEMVPANQRVCSSLLFPLTLFGTVRALAIDSDRFTRLFNRMCDELGDKAKKILFEDGRSEGMEIIESIKNFFDDSQMPEKALIYANAKAVLRSLGWGTMFFSRMNATDIYRVTVLDPPTDADGEMAVSNYFLHGIIAGIIEALQDMQGKRLTMMKEFYDRDTRALKIFYMEKSKAQKPSPSSEEPLQIKLRQPLTSASPSKEEIAKQVERVISSIDNIQQNSRPRRKKLLSEARRKKIISQNLEEILDEVEKTAQVYHTRQKARVL